jgi:cholesterol transport system auxiliary component
MTPVANHAASLRAKGLVLLISLALAGCTLPGKRLPGVVYDFGPGAVRSLPAHRMAPLPALALGEVRASPALDGTAVLYRLAYSDAQQLKPYAQARWSMAPAQLVRQRLSEHLGQRRALLSPGDVGPAGTPTPPTLRVELEEFSQLFETPTASVGLLRLRATVVQPGPGGEQLVAQRSVIVQQPAPTADASGGVRALTAATDAAMQELALWLQDLKP